MRKEEKSILIGACIGDGYLWKDPNSKSVSLVLKHSINQKEYLLHKVNMLRSILGGSENKIVEFNNSGYLGIRLSKSSKYFRIIRKWLYKNNKKSITKILLNKLTPQAIAIWWMDDGSMYKKLNKTTKKIKGLEGILSTYTSLQENQIIVDFFKEKYDIEFNIVKSKQSYRLRLNTTNCKKLAELIKPYIIESMSYKIQNL